MKNVKGKVLDRQSKPVYGARVFLSDISGNITPSKLGTTTDFNGEFTLNIPDNNDGTHLTATSSDGGRNTHRYNSNITNYEFDLSYAQTQNLQEVVVTANRPTSNTSTENNKPKPNVSVDTSKYKKRIFIGLGILATLIVVVGTIYILRKNK